MMTYKFRESAHLLIDNRLSGGVLLETETKRCAHCRRQILLDPPNIRKREPRWCRKCDAYICNNIECVMECRPFDQAIEDFVTSGVLPHNR